MAWFKKIFGGSGEPEPAANGVVAALIADLDSADAAVRLRACQALGELGAKAGAATERLQQLFTDSDGDVCNAAANAYSRIERGF